MRYYYTTVGYGVFSLIGEFYRMGRVEIYDREDNSGYAVDEGTYCMPFEAAQKFEDFIESLETDMPIQFEVGSVRDCSVEASKKLNIPIDKLNDKETRQKFYKEKYKDNPFNKNK